MLAATLITVSLLASLGRASFFSTLKSKFTRSPKVPSLVAKPPEVKSLPHHSIKRVWNTVKDFHTGWESASLEDKVLSLPQGVLYHSHIEPEETQHTGKGAIIHNDLVYKPYKGEGHVVWKDMPFGVETLGASHDASVIASYYAGKLHVNENGNIKVYDLKGPIKRLKVSADGKTISFETPSGGTLVRVTSNVLGEPRADLPNCTRCRFSLAMDKAICLCTPEGTKLPVLTLYHLSQQSEQVVKHFISKGNFNFEKGIAPVSWLVTPDGKHALISTSNAHVHLYDMAKGTLKSHTVVAASGKVKLRSLSSAQQFLFTLEVLNKSSGAKELSVWRGDFGKDTIEQLHIPVAGAREKHKLAFDVTDPEHVVQRSVTFGSLPIHVMLTVFEVERATTKVNK